MWLSIGWFDSVSTRNVVGFQGFDISLRISRVGDECRTSQRDEILRAKCSMILRTIMIAMPESLLSDMIDLWSWIELLNG